jgi:hypothetical protein
VDLSHRLAASDRGDIAHPESPAAGPLAVAAQGGKFGATGDGRDHALSLWRPLRRRERRTARPPRVDLRARKPCFIARLRLFGWNVRFMKISSGHKHRPTKASVASSYSATRLPDDTDLSGPQNSQRWVGIVVHAEGRPEPNKSAATRAACRHKARARISHEQPTFSTGWVESVAKCC